MCFPGGVDRFYFTDRDFLMPFDDPRDQRRYETIHVQMGELSEWNEFC